MKEDNFKKRNSYKPSREKEKQTYNYTIDDDC